MKPDGVGIMVDDVGDTEPNEFFVQLGMLILESRQPSISIKGRQDGPHCPKDVGVWSGHVCESTTPQCNRAGQIVKQMQTLWRNHVPLCIEVLILPSCRHGLSKSSSTDVTPPYEDDGYVLLEQWTIQSIAKKPGESLVACKTLFQALKSYLHFSQLTSWLSSSRGSRPSCIGYRVSPPAEFCTTTFTQDPQLHVFPVGSVNKSTNFKVWLAYLSRMPEIPEPICYELSEDGRLCSSNSSGSCSGKEKLSKKRLSGSRSPRPRFEAVFQNIRGSPKLVSKSCSTALSKHHLRIQHCQPVSVHEDSKSHSNIGMPLEIARSVLEDSMYFVEADTKDDAYRIGFNDCKPMLENKLCSGLINQNSRRFHLPKSSSMCNEEGIRNLTFALGRTTLDHRKYETLEKPHDDKPVFFSDQLQCDYKDEAEGEDDDDRCHIINKAPPSLEHPKRTLPCETCGIQRNPLARTLTDSVYIFDDGPLHQGGNRAIDASTTARPSTPINIESKKGKFGRNVSVAQMLLKDQNVTDSDNSCSPDIDLFLSETLDKRAEPMNPEEMSEYLLKLCKKRHLRSRCSLFASAGRAPLASSKVCHDPNKPDLGVKRQLNIESRTRKLEDLSSSVLKKKLEQEIEAHNLYICDCSLKSNRICDSVVCPNEKLGLSNASSAYKKSKSCSCFMNDPGQVSTVQDDPQGCSKRDLSLLETLKFLESIKEQSCRKRYRKDVDGGEEFVERKAKVDFLDNNKDCHPPEDYLKAIIAFKQLPCCDSSPAGHISRIQQGFCVNRESQGSNSRVNNNKRDLASSGGVNVDIIDTLATSEAGQSLKGRNDLQQQKPNSSPPSSLSLASREKQTEVTPIVPLSALPRRFQSKTPQDLKHPSVLFLQSQQQQQLQQQQQKQICSRLKDPESKKDTSPGNSHTARSNHKQEFPQIPSDVEKADFHVRVQHSSSMVFNATTKLPMQSSPVPAKRLSSDCFDYDSSLNSVQAIKNSLSCNNLNDAENSNDGCNRLKRAFSSSAPASTNCLLGNFEESLINGRIQPAGVIDGFTAEIGASGSFCPPHLTLPCLAFFFSLSDDSAPSPYLGHVNLEGHTKRGYKVPNKGTVQVTLFNPNKSVVKIFVVTYDVSDMPPNHQTLLRQKTVYMPTPGSPSDIPGAAVYLRYLIHLRFSSSKQCKVYLHTDIRLIFARDRFELDNRIYHYELRSFNEAPENPKYSPRR